MIDELPNDARHDANVYEPGSVTDIRSRRRRDDILTSISLVFGGVHFGTFPVSAPYTRGKPLVLYFVAGDGDFGDEGVSGPIDCLLTDDALLGAELDLVR